MSLIDSHCHLDLPHFDEDRDEVVARAAEAGVETIVTIGIDIPSSRAAIALAERYPKSTPRSACIPTIATVSGRRRWSSYASWPGIPKWSPSAKSVWITTGTQRRRTARRKSSSSSLIWRRNLACRWSSTTGKPTKMCGRSSSLGQGGSLPGSPLARTTFAGVLHSFSGDLAMAEEAYGWGFVLGLAGPVTFKNARQLHALVPHLRPDRMMIETDAPYLTPHPYRGKRNEPARVRLVAEKLAELWEMPFDVVK